jgi:hypothetical protein
MGNRQEAAVCASSSRICNVQQCTLLVAVSAGINRQRAAVLATRSRQWLQQATVHSRQLFAAGRSNKQQCSADTRVQQAAVCSWQQCSQQAAVFETGSSGAEDSTK